MKASNYFKHLFFTFSFSLIVTFSFAQSENGFNMQRKGNNSIVFVAENTKIKVRLNNGNEVAGKLSGADSNAIYITKNTGKQKAVPIGTINKMTIFHPHPYFTLMDGLIDVCVDGCGNGCTVVGSALALIGVVAITAGELIVDGIADVANDEHYDMVNNWKIIGPVVGR